MSETTPPAVLALVRDLMFSSKISTLARQLRVEVKIVRDPQKLQGETGRVLIVDLNLPEAIPAASDWRTVTGGTVFGFVSHVDTETITRAREAGIDHVMARSGFVEALPNILTG